MSPSIPDSATVIGPDYAQLSNGKVVNLSNGQEVTNPKIVGTATTPPDPGAASGGMNFIPEQVGNVRKQMKQLQESQSKSAETGAYIVKTASYLPNGQYGAFWSSNSNGGEFYDAQGQLFVQQAKGVVDVSQWNGNIDWSELKNEGVQGAIIRLDYGSYNGYDSEALNNIDQCLKLGIPIGIYVYSYAYNSQVAYGEGSYAATLLQQAGLSPSQLPLGIYYDLEAYSWYAHPHPTSPEVYQGIVSSFFEALSADGYTNASVYSYPEYLQTALNTSYIYQHVGWVASYASDPGFYQWDTNFRGWQYGDEGEIPGANGYVDLDAVGYASYTPLAWGDNLSSYPAANLPDGDYYIDLASDLTTSLQAPSGQEGIQMNTAAGDRSQGQIWYLHRNPNGSYGILNTLGNYWLDVWQGNQTPGNKIDQWIGNGLPTQQWYIREVNNAYILQPELGNICLGIGNGQAEVQTPTGASSQLFRLSAVNNSIPLNTPVTVTSGGQALSDPEFSHDNLVQLAVSPFTGANNQQWEISEKADGLYQLKNVYSGLLMDDFYGGTDPGNIVDQDVSNGLNPQLWLLGSPSEISFVSAVSTNLMTDTNGKTTIQAPGTAGQTWQVETYHSLNLSSYPAANLPDGDYYIDLASDLTTSLQAPSSQEGIQINTAAGDRSQGQ
ncbi:MAG: RICIN domain-containing protein, partial [Aeriscardovia sp.]|nr:RICIN domain-containing protein [Aeriscardovia sp.]